MHFFDNAVRQSCTFVVLKCFLRLQSHLHAVILPSRSSPHSLLWRPWDWHGASSDHVLSTLGPRKGPRNHQNLDKVWTPSQCPWHHRKCSEGHQKPPKKEPPLQHPNSKLQKWTSNENCCIYMFSAHAASQRKYFVLSEFSKPCSWSQLPLSMSHITSLDPNWYNMTPKGPQIHPKWMRSNSGTPRCPMRWTCGSLGHQSAHPGYQNRASRSSKLHFRVTRITLSSRKSINRSNPWQELKVQKETSEWLPFDRGPVAGVKPYDCRCGDNNKMETHEIG